MANGTASYLNPPGSLDLGPFNPIRVYRLGLKGYELLPHVRAVSVSTREGAEPGSAQCYYVFDETLATEIGSPVRFESVWGMNAVGKWVVKPDDRIVIAQDNPPDLTRPPSTPPTRTILFAGFAQAPQLDLSDGEERVTFVVLGQPVREWDTPIGGAIYRDGAYAKSPGGWESDRGIDEYESLNEHDWPTDLPCRFNPDGLPNATPAGHDSGNAAEISYPVFLDPLIVRTPDVRRYWTVSMAARYILQRGNPKGKWSRYNDVLWQIDGLLKVRVPKNANTPIDLSDGETYDWQDVICQDLDITGKAWPEALRDVIEPHGWTFVWRIGQGKDPYDKADVNAKDRPIYQLAIYRKDEPPSSRYVSLQAAGNVLDTNLTNVSGLGLNFDSTRIVNAYIVDSEPALYESTWILNPLFEIDAADGAHPKYASFAKSAAMGKADPRKYREFGVDETGDGHWDFQFVKWLTMATDTPDSDSIQMWTALTKDMEKLFTDRGTIEDFDSQTRRFAARRRPALRSLISTDPVTGSPLSAKLWVMEKAKYNGALIGQFRPDDLAADGALQPILAGGWELLTDRLGIRISVEDPNSWHIGQPWLVTEGGTPTKKLMTNPAFPQGIINTVQCLAAPGANGSTTTKQFVLVLTCVVQGDRGVSARAGRRLTSPTTYPITRRDDARDRYRFTVLAKDSEFNENAERTVIRDDTAMATNHAVSRRTATEALTLAGSITVGRLARGIRIGDQVTAIQGRGVSLRVSAVAGQKQTPRYPVVVGIDWGFSPRLHTVYHVQDRRTEGVKIGSEGGLIQGKTASRVAARSGA